MKLVVLVDNNTYIDQYFLVRAGTEHIHRKRR